MPSVRFSAFVFVAIVIAVTAFQIGLALGAPWGAYAMGGAYPGVYPPSMRAAAVLQAVIYGVMAAVVLSRAGVMRWQRFARIAIWVVVAVLLVSTVLNVITPSAGERVLWAPVAAVLFLLSLRVAFGRQSSLNQR